MKPYSGDRRERLPGAIDAGLSRAEAARLWGVGPATVEWWQRRRRETGGVAPLPRRGRPRRIGPAQETPLLAQVRATPDATLAEHGARWERAQGVRVSAATMARSLAVRDVF